MSLSDPFGAGNNTSVFMTRRMHRLPRKVLMRDSKTALRLARAWDEERDARQVLDIFLKEQDNLSDERYWEFLRTVWIVAGSVANTAIFRELMGSRRKERYCFSTPEDAARLRAMPERFEVHRATDDISDGGIAWTLSREYAEDYARMFAKSTIVSREVARQDVFAFIARNREEEVILL